MGGQQPPSLAQAEKRKPRCSLPIAPDSCPTLGATTRPHVSLKSACEGLSLQPDRGSLLSASSEPRLGPDSDSRPPGRQGHVPGPLCLHTCHPCVLRSS